MAKETVLIFLVMVLCSTHLLLAEEMSTEEFRLRTNMAREAKRRSPPERYSILKRLHENDSSGFSANNLERYMKMVSEAYSSYARHSPLAKEGKELVLAQRLLTHSRVSVEPIPKETLRYWDDLAAFTAHLEREVEVTQMLKVMNLDQQHQVTWALYEEIAMDLILHHNRHESWFVSLSPSLFWDSNVAQAPDDFTLPSGKSGTGFGLSGVVSKQFREVNNYQWSADSTLTLSEYADSSFEGYEYMTLGAGASVKIGLQETRFATFLRPRFSMSATYTGGDKDLSYYTYGTRVTAGHHSKKNLSSYSRLFLMLTSLGVSYQDYQDGSDPVTDMSLQWVGVNISPSSLKQRTNFILNLSSRSSDALLQDYSGLRFDLIHTYDLEAVEVSPGLAWQKRDYSKVIGGRDDDTFELSVSAAWSLSFKGSKMRATLKHIKRDSTISFFSYDSTQATLNMSIPL